MIREKINNIFDLRYGDARLCLKEILKYDNREIKIIILRKICDFIAGMTDKFSLEQYEKLYVPNKY